MRVVYISPNVTVYVHPKTLVIYLKNMMLFVRCDTPPRTATSVGIGRVPDVDASRFLIAGFSLGGTVALHAAALDARAAGVASFSGFTPMRNDTAGRPTGGLRRVARMHALVPRLGGVYGTVCSTSRLVETKSKKLIGLYVMIDFTRVNV